MEVLHYEMLDASTPMWVPLFLIGVSLIFAIGMGLEIGKKQGITFAVVCIAVIIIGFLTEEDEYYEYQKAIVEDWNVVHNEGWTVISQEGEITVLKRKLEEK